jgi:hypothetical protein
VLEAARILQFATVEAYGRIVIECPPTEESATLPGSRQEISRKR